MGTRNRGPLLDADHRRHTAWVWLALLLLSVLIWRGGLSAKEAEPSHVALAQAVANDTPSPTTSDGTATATRTATPTRTTTPSPTATSTPQGWLGPGDFEVLCGGTFLGDTTGKPNRATIYSCQSWIESGPEDVYVIHKLVKGDLTVRIESIGTNFVDFDLFLLNRPYGYACLYSTENSATWAGLDPGTYYLVVDGYLGAEGAYRLMISCPNEPSPTPTNTLTPTPTNTPEHSYWPIICNAPTPTPRPTATATPTPRPYAKGVNCGGPEYWSSDARFYEADRPYTPGGWGWTGGREDFVTTTDRAIAGTQDALLYQSQRYAMEAYRFDVDPGRYTVVLRFAEIFRYVNVGQRVFSVEIEGQRVLDQLDLLSKGARDRAYDRTFSVEVTDGRLDIVFVQNPGYDYAPVINALWVEREQGF